MKGYLPQIILFIVLVVVIMSVVTLMTSLDNSSKCANSPYNIYSNSTEGYSQIGNKCYVSILEHYETRERCGTLGISCYEASEPHTEAYYTSVCFNIKTGMRCR